MKEKLKKIFIPIFLSVICGSICGRLLFSIYDEKGSNILSSNVIREYYYRVEAYSHYEFPFKGEDKTIIDISNTFNNKVDMNKIKNKKYSTKGKNRGYGLYIMNRLLKDNENISVDQSIKNKFFISKIIIKK